MVVIALALHATVVAELHDVVAQATPASCAVLDSSPYPKLSPVTVTELPPLTALFNSPYEATAASKLSDALAVPTMLPTLTADTPQTVLAALRRHCPERINIYFDNVGGTTWDAATAWMALDGRIVICGSIAEYNESGAPVGPRRLKEFETWRMRMQGFRVGDYMPRYPEARAAMVSWIAEGRLRYRESVSEGLESAPLAFIGLLQGHNLGKQLVRLAPDAHSAVG